MHVLSFEFNDTGYDEVNVLLSLLVSRNFHIARIGEDMCNRYSAHHFLFTYVVG